MPDRIPFVPVDTTTRHFAGRNAGLFFVSTFDQVLWGKWLSPMMHCARDSRWLPLSSARVGQQSILTIY
ncbi:hypothetical protein TNCV_3422001 [Trichonephila clavipes]|nr:hypothetical protein TNCV_3422001 [Trichonephila clavipes]